MLEETCYRIDVIDVPINDDMPHSLLRDPLEALLYFASSTGDVSPLSAEVDKLEVPLTGGELDSFTSHERERLVHDTQLIEVKKPELKPLPLSLRYAFLDESEYYLVIVSSLLNDCQMSELFAILRLH